MVTTVDIVFDVEADGKFPGRYSMHQLGAVAIIGGKEIKHDFMAYLRPVTEFYEPEALSVCGVTREETMAYPDHEIGVSAFNEWLLSLKRIYNTDRLQGWSDNPAFDWQFVHHYLMMTYSLNPLGHSCRRIGDLYAGLIGKPRDQSSWKKLKDTKHTHVAIDDARGNGEALIKILAKQL